MSDSTEIAAQAPRRSIVPVTSPVAMFDTARFEHYGRIATMMAEASLLPDHLVKVPNLKTAIANCFLIVSQADRWNMDPFALAQSCFILHGKIGYEGKLIAAVIESKVGAIDYEWNEETPGADKYGITVTAARPSDGKRVSLGGTVGDWKTYEKEKNEGGSTSRQVKGNWRGLASRNQLAYRGIREWARLYAPGLVLGVYSDDEMEEMELEHRMRDITPAMPDPDAETERKTRKVRTAATGGEPGNKYQEGSVAHDPKTGEIAESDADKAIRLEAERKANADEADKAKAAKEAKAAEAAAKKEAEKAEAAAKKEAEKAAKQAAKEQSKPATPAAGDPSKVRLIDIVPELDHGVPLDVEKMLTGFHDEMGKATEIGGENPAAGTLRAIWRQYNPPGGPSWAATFDPLFAKVREWHKARVTDEIAARAKPKPATKQDDGFGDGPPDPDADEEKGAPFDLAVFIAGLTEELAKATNADDVQRFFNEMTEAPLRDKLITVEQFENDLRPLAIESMSRFD